MPSGRQENTLSVAINCFKSLLEKARDAQILCFKGVIFSVSRNPLSYGMLESSRWRFDLILFNFMNNHRNNILYLYTLKNTFPNFYSYLLKKILRCNIYPFCIWESWNREPKVTHLVSERGDIQTFGLHVATSSHCPRCHPSSVWWTASAIKNSSPSKPSLVCDAFSNHTIWLCTYYVSGIALATICILSPILETILQAKNH